MDKTGWLSFGLVVYLWTISIEKIGYESNLLAHFLYDQQELSKGTFLQKVHFPDSGLKPLSRSTNVPKVALIWRADFLYFKYNYKADDFVIEEAHEKTHRGPK